VVPAYNLELAAGDVILDLWFDSSGGRFPAFTG